MFSLSKKHILFPIYLFGFLFAFHAAVPTYINSSFLNVFLPEKFVGLVYMSASILTVLFFLLMPFILKRFGNYRTAFFLIALDMIALLGLAFSGSTAFLLVAFVVNLVTIPLTYFSTDIFLESVSKNKETGLVRGVYLTSVNLAWACSPLISGLVLINGDYWKIYLASFFLLVPLLMILVSNLKGSKDADYTATHVLATAKIIWKSKDLSAIFTSNFLLFFFYSWMTIYTPLYLHKYIGFSWSEIGVIFSIMLLPFILIELPLGKLADRKWGEKEILTLGFLLIAISTGLISFITSTNIFVWALILFITRIGAATIEIMSDTYFFKKVSSLDANAISFYRMSGPLAYICGPLVATLLFSLLSFDIKYLFLVLGLIMFIGLKFSLSLKDTK